MGYVAYAMMNILNRQEQAKYVTFFTLGMLSYEHISSKLRDPLGYDMSVTTYTMLLACKMSAVAWCYKDGEVWMNHEKLKPEDKEKDINKLSKD